MFNELYNNIKNMYNVFYDQCNYGQLFKFVQLDTNEIYDKKNVYDLIPRK